jgi:capsule polysaccharide export protein KpsE/RkpR
VLARLAVSEAQQRRVFYEQQLKDTKEHLIKAEQDLRRVQEKSGVIVLDKQAEALIGGAAQLRALIAEREVQLKVLRTGATEQNPDVMR